MLQLNGQTHYIRQYTDIDGLPSMNVYTVLQGDDGLIWLTTDNGICYFDGNDFVNLSHPKMRDLDFIGIKKGFNGRVWFWNWSGQLFYHEKGKLEFYSPNGALDHEVVRNIILINEKEIWLELPTGQKGPIYCELGEGCNRNFNQEKRRSLLSFYNEFTDKFPDRSLSCKGQVFKNFKEKIDINQKGFDGRVYISANLGLMAIPHESNTVWKINTEKNLKADSLFSLEDKLIRKVYEDREENIWVLTDNMPVLLNKNFEKQPISAIYPFVNKVDINNLFQDKKGNYWFVTNGEGLYFVRKNNFNTFPAKIPSFKNVTSVIQGYNNDVIVSNSSGYITIFDEDQSSMEFTDLGKNIKKLYKRKTGQGYLMLSSLGFFILDNDFDVLHVEKKLGSLKDVYENERGFFVGRGFSGNYVLKETEDKTYDFLDILSYRLVYTATYAFAEYNQDLILGTLDGLYIVENVDSTSNSLSKLEKASEENKKRGANDFKAQRLNILPLSSPVNTNWVQDLYVDRKNRLWVATNNAGIYCVKDSVVVQFFNTSNGLSSNNCVELKEDDDGVIWAATPVGINAIYPETGRVEVITFEHGLPANRITSICLTEDRVWAGTPKGISILHKKDLALEDSLSNVIFTKLILNGSDTSIENEYILSHKNNSIQLSFVLPTSERQKSITYHYRLNKNNWISTNSKELSLSNLAAGKYQLQIYATSLSGLTSPINEHLTFIVLTPFWQTWWFYLLGVVFGGSLISLVTYLFVNRIRKQREKAINFRRELSESKMKALQSQMNPHFIFNALNAIQHFFTSDARELALLHLNKFAKLIRLIFEYSKETSISLDSELHFLKLYLELEGLRFENKIDIDFTIDENIYQEEIFLPPLMIQPMIENAFKHGLLHKEGKGNLKVEFKQLDENIIKCIIEDNGIGREAAKVHRKWRMKEHRSSGLENTKERIQLYNQEFGEAAITFNVIDLEEDGEAVGTKVEFFIKKTEEEE